MFVPGNEILVASPEWIPPAEPGDPSTILVTLRQGDLAEQITFRINGADVSESPLGLEAMLPLVLVPAMKLGSPIRFAAPLASQILEGARKFQEIFSVWYPEFQPISIYANSTPIDRDIAPLAQGSGVFFSGGLDSSYSLLKHRTGLTHAIFIHGCDIPLTNIAYRDATQARLAETAHSLGITLITVETDLLRFSDAYCHWGYHYHGSALAAMAMLLGSSLSRVYIASSTSFLRIVPWGSSYVTDPLWSTPRMQVIYDGAEKERLGKIETLIRFPVALDNLRVCFETPDGGYNCCKCEKCFRTMVGLRLLGALDACKAFEHPLDLDAMVAHPEVVMKFAELRSWRINSERARLGNDTELIQALEEIHRRSSFLKLVNLLSREKTLSSPRRLGDRICGNSAPQFLLVCATRIRNGLPKKSCSGCQMPETKPSGVSPISTGRGLRRCCCCIGLGGCARREGDCSAAPVPGRRKPINPTRD